MIKRIIITVCLLSSLIISGCGFNYMSYLYYNDKEISSDTNSFSLNDESQTIDNQSYVGKIEFEGMDTIWEFNSETNTEVEISYLLSVTKGKAKLVLIKPDGDLETIVENKNNTKKSKMNSTKLSITKGENRIKLVAQDNAQIELEINVSNGELSKLGFAD
ncbi:MULTISPECIES: hypothetical protein [Peptostreptococcaceae]|uniref:hypothetical protein n=1 Tax=Peptostreptococcaceae TaxID=186804 RepID=UPI00346557FB